MTGLSLTLRSEYRKFVTTKLWWILLVAMAGYMAFLGGVLAWAMTSSPEGMAMGSEPVVVTEETIRATVYGTATSMGYVFPLIIGALSMTNEFRHKTITPTFLAAPRRGNVLVAKMISALPIGFFYGLAATVTMTLAAAGVLAATGQPTLLGDGETLAMLARSVLALTLWAPVGVALGSIMTNQVVAIIVILVYTQFVEALVRMGLGMLGTVGETIAAYLPGPAGESITGGSLYSAADMAVTVPWGAGLLALACYGVLFAVIGNFTTLRRDVA